VSLDDISLDNLTSTDTTVVFTLRSREAAGGPAIGSVISAE
jgi:hypothetical protein